MLLWVYTQPSGLLTDELGFLESPGLTSFLPNNVVRVLRSIVSISQPG